MIIMYIELSIGKMTKSVLTMTYMCYWINIYCCYLSYQYMYWYLFFSNWLLAAV
jgi:hypothetical protein